MEGIWKTLQSQIDGEVFRDTATRILYATDASLFQQIPLAVVRPRHRDDCIAILHFANAHHIPVIPRAAGTSLAGQCVGEGLIIDIAHHMNHVNHIDIKNKLAVVEPGIVLQTLNQQLEASGLMFPIDPSTADRCTLGGMVGNNAWGVHTPRYGATRDHVSSIDALLSDGTVIEIKTLNAQELIDKQNLKSVEGDLYRAVFQAIDQHLASISQRLSPASVLRDNSGYALHSLASNPHWKQSFNMAPLLCGSEGTLALMTRITVKLAPLPGQRFMVCAHYSALSDAISAVPDIANLKPVAIELLDHTILGASGEINLQRQNRFWIAGDPHAVLLIEVEEWEKIALIRQLLEETACYAAPVIYEPDIDKVWALRRAGLAMLMGHDAAVKIISAIEDAAVPLNRLAEYFQQVDAVMRDYNLDCVYYGPVSVGVLHIRPWMDLHQAEERLRFIQLLRDIAAIVAELGGVMSAKHGDGRIRGWLLSTMLGNELYLLHENIKKAADPQGLLNPGVIFSSNPPDEFIRHSDRQMNTTVSSAFSWAGENGFSAALEKCNGAAVCLKAAGYGVMCPSYQASRHEQHVTRGRANTLRIMFQQAGIKGLASPEVHQALDLCLSCKGCKQECPASVDMAKLKAETLHQRHEYDGIPLRTRLIGNFDRISKLAYHSRGLFNPLIALTAPCFLNLHTDRPLPRVAKQSFTRWTKKHQPHPQAESKGHVILLNDSLINYYEPGIGIAAVETLERLGYQVTVSPCVDSVQLLISQGLLRQAKKSLAIIIRTLSKLANQGQFIIGLEPSELLTLRDEAVDLLDGELSSLAKTLSNRSLLFEEFLIKEFRHLKLPDKRLPEKVLIHEHCHQQSLCERQQTQQCLSLICDAKTVSSGCCGMAGLFGYEKSHYNLSLQIAELELLPAIRRADKNTLIVATGASCRKQILDTTGQKALHSSEVFRRFLE